jgi:hypothetical protein
VIDPDIAGLMRRMIQRGFMQHSYIISNRFARFLAIRLANHKGGLLLTTQNLLFFTENYARFGARVLFSAGAGIIVALTNTLLTSFPYVVLMMVAAFDATANCGVRCENHFRELTPNQEPIEILVEREENNLVIASNNDEVEIFTPEPEQTNILKRESNSPRRERSYKSTGRRAKLVKFSEWRKTDPELQAFADKFDKSEEAPYVPNRKCALQKAEDLAGLE